MFCFNTQPPEGGWANKMGGLTRLEWFQHTAARRRLAQSPKLLDVNLRVSTHSRPKAAGTGYAPPRYAPACFNTQPPEGGW